MSTNGAVHRRRWILGGGLLAIAVVAAIAVVQVGGLFRPVTGGPAVPAATASSTGPSESTSPRATEPAKGETQPADPKTSVKPEEPTSAEPKKSASAEPPGKEAQPKESAKPTKPGSGKTVPVEEVKTLEPVDLDEKAAVSKQFSIRVTDIDRVKGKATAPGEIAGPAVRLKIRADNKSDEAFDFSHALIFVSYGDQQTPASELIKGTKPLPDRVPADSSRIGRYIFAIPSDAKQVRVEVSYSGAEPTLSFEGPLDD